ncbi:diguanylate cyclase [Candidatus Woesearchaeota archaeon]|nr:diguanylate cyclase [Candidatus Woesearchaeota archaeon]
MTNKTHPDLLKRRTTIPGFPVKKSLDDLIKGIVNDPESHINREGAILALQSSYRSAKEDPGFGIQNLLEVIGNNLQLSFCGVYLTERLNVHVERDPQSGEMLYEKSVDFDEYVRKNQEPLMLHLEGHSRFVVPIVFHESCFGYAVFDKSLAAAQQELAFSESDLATIVMSVNLFGTHINQMLKFHELYEENQKLQDRISLVQKHATLDGMTGVLRRDAFDVKYSELAESARKSGKPISVIMIDVDNFKKYNDTYGHPAGDRILSAVTEIMRKSVRGADVFARYGGEDFVVVLPDTPLTRAYDVARRMNHAVRNMTFQNDLPKESAIKQYAGERDSTSVTISLGVASSEDLPKNCKESSAEKFSAALVQAADGNLYIAKVLRDSVYAGNFLGQPNANDRHGLPDVSQLYPALKRHLRRCQESDENLAVLMYYAVRFRDVTRTEGQQKAWRLFKDSTNRLRSELVEAQHMVRVCDSERVIAVVANKQHVSAFEESLYHLGQRSLQALHKFQLERVPAKPIDFALGVVTYHQEFVTAEQKEKLYKTPALLVNYAQHVVREAEKISPHFALQRYGL